jgi:hypothetical protein
MQFSPGLEQYRITIGRYRSDPYEQGGAFRIPNGPGGRALFVVADAGLQGATELAGWEHVSVSIDSESARRKQHLPSWVEMDFIKRLFWDDEECVVQFHPPRSRWVNNMPVLHLWRSIKGEFPMPHPLLIGVKEVGEFKSKADGERAKQLMEQQIAELG